MKITILDDYADLARTLPGFSRLAGHEVTIWNDHVRDVDALAARLAATEALILLRERTPIPGELIARLANLRVIAMNGPWPHVDLAACTARGIALCSGHPRTSYATAELAWGLIIASLRHLPREIARLKAGHWQSTVGRGLRGKMLGVFGYGRIGGQVAGFGRAFGMDVVVWSRERGLAAAQVDGYRIEARKEALFDHADVVTLHVRLVPATRGIVTAADLARMKPTALLVNTSRAGLIEDGALVAALKAGRPGYAAVDVYEEEPLTDRSHPLLALENAICTPHLGYVERDQLAVYFENQFARVLAYANGSPVDVVNPEVLHRTTGREGIGGSARNSRVVR